MYNLIAFVLVQAATISSPPLQGSNTLARRDGIVLKSLSPVRSTAKAPVAFAAGDMRDPEAILRLHKEGEAETLRLGIQSTVQPVTVDPGYGCRKDSQHPMGFELRNDKRLNGLMTTFRCRGFVLSVQSDDFSRALKVETSAGFSESEKVAIVNGGALTKRFGVSNDGIRDVTYIWIGKTIAHTLSLRSRTTDPVAMEVAGDHFIDVFTRK
ncbi:hypothetical protein FHT00_002844 [Sphingomonas insulae]|uniref:DUF4892 domain-containing protein n=1 Tax=Sphingomonas insulae TaxID=424800 RepID=A0ABN1HNG0_9SPHN|nr:hypothetical protein [Sphingomonas insulae]NIJ30871.1 hypothetical protein [Sphingomonas insulae]